MVFLRFPDENGLSQIVMMCAVLAFVGFSVVLMAPPLMAEITHFLQEVEEKEPGVFGRNGAYAQGVSNCTTGSTKDQTVHMLTANHRCDTIVWTV